MDIPSKLKIAGHEVEVIVGPFRERGDIKGRANYTQNTIQVGDVDGGGTPSSRSDIEVTFLHEIIHHVWARYHGGTEQDEKVVDALAEGLYQVLKDNRLKFFDD